uniref:Uncharacterized protein n=1 Tax=Chrysotila carterae TaxID=13221 RepID=A0A7S4EZS8_CHRCT
MLEADTESTLAAGQRNTSSDEAAEAEATRLFLLRCCTERAVAGEVDDVMASVGSTTDVSKLIHDTLNERYDTEGHITSCLALFIARFDSDAIRVAWNNPMPRLCNLSAHQA